MLPPPLLSSPRRAVPEPLLDSRYRTDPSWYVRTAGCALVVSVSCAPCDSAPLVARTAIDAMPTGAIAGTVNASERVCPAVSTKGDDGETVTPCGTPCSVTVTESLKPFCGATDKTTGAVVLPVTAKVASGVMTGAKSALGGGGPAEPPPHAAASTPRQIGSDSA